MSEKIVIIGGVAAGPKAACRVKRLMPDAQVTVIDMASLISYGGGFNAIRRIGPDWWPK